MANYIKMDLAELERQIRGMEEGYDTLSGRYLAMCFVAAIKRAKARIFDGKEEAKK